MTDTAYRPDVWIHSDLGEKSMTTILVIEDTQSVRKTLRQLLEVEGNIILVSVFIFAVSAQAATEVKMVGDVRIHGNWFPKQNYTGWNGDGTSTYHKITGVCAKLKGLSGTIANIAGLVVGTGNAYSELILGDFTKVKSKLPQYADTVNAAWYCHKTFYHSVMEQLMVLLPVGLFHGTVAS